MPIGITSPESMIADLDAALADVGTTIRLERLTAGPDGIQIPFGVDVPAMITAYEPQDLVVNPNGVPPSKVIISPTFMLRRKWPLPPLKDDAITINGRTGRVEGVEVFTVQGVDVRYQLTAR